MSTPFPKTADKVKGVQILGPIPDDAKHIFNQETLAFVATLHRGFEARRQNC